MIVSKTPLRISFFGGGSDIPEFYEGRKGMTLSTTIDKYIYIAANKCVAPHIKAIYSELELEYDVNKIKHDRIRETLKNFGITSNIEICSFSDIPTKGSGLGSSSTFTVGLINALFVEFLKTKNPNKKVLAELACTVEIDFCKEPIGKQDQYAAAYGGLNLITYTKNKIEVEEIYMKGVDKSLLNSSLMLFNTGKTRLASSVLSYQLENIKNKDSVDNIRSLASMAEVASMYLKTGRLNSFGDLLDEAWKLKKTLAHNVTNPLIDEMYETAKNAGALGGKILGAGGGGYLMVYVPEKSRNSVLSSMEKYERMFFNFTNEGSSLT